MKPLPKKATIAQAQKFIKDLCDHHGWHKNSSLEIFLLFTEEVGELEKAIRYQEDIQKDPEKFMQSIYKFLGVDPSFKASMLYKRVNVARVPKNIDIDKNMHHFSEYLRKIGLDKFVHAIRKTGIPDFVRNLNTKQKTEKKTLSPQERDLLIMLLEGKIASPNE